MENLFYKILSNWGTFSESEKVRQLQEFENMTAEFQKREPRTVVFCPDCTKHNTINAEFKFDEPDKIYLYNIQKEPISILNSIVHEGYHCLFYDFFSVPSKDTKKTEYRIIGSYDIKQLQTEKKNINLLYNMAVFLDKKTNNDKYLTAFNLCYYEEETIRTESCLYLLHNILYEMSHNENANLNILIVAYFNLIKNYCLYEMYDNMHKDYYTKLKHNIENETYQSMYKDKIVNIDENATLYQIENASTIISLLNQSAEKMKLALIDPTKEKLICKEMFQLIMSCYEKYKKSVISFDL